MKSVSVNETSSYASSLSRARYPMKSVSRISYASNLSRFKQSKKEGYDYSLSESIFFIKNLRIYYK